MNAQIAQIPLLLPLLFQWLAEYFVADAI